MVETLTERLSMPRVQISIILALTALAAFAASVVMLRMGVTSMTLRYPIAVIVGYLSFLLLLRIWIWLQNENAGADLDISLPDGVPIPNIGSSGSVSKDGFDFGGGGDFKGAGAGGGWIGGKPVPIGSFAPQPVSAGSTTGGSSGSWDLDLDLDDGVALILVGIVVVLVLSALIYVIYIAPILLAELVIDGAVVGSLYRPVANIERSHWMVTALKRTGIPAIAVVLLVLFGSFVMEAAEPEAVTIGQFLNAVL